MGAAVAVLVPIVAVVLIVLALLFFGRRQNAKDNDLWQRGALGLGLQWAPDPEGYQLGRMEGTIEAYSVSVFLAKVQSSSKPSQSWPFTRVRTGLDVSAGAGLIACGRKMNFNYLAKAEALPRVSTGDAAFDQAFGVGARDPARAQRLLSSAVRGALMQAEAGAGGVFVEDDSVLSERMGITRDLGEIGGMLKAQVALARVLSLAWR